MSQIHLCNTFFEKELASAKERTPAEWLRSHPIPLQLQFLPLLYAASDDLILVTDLPPSPDRRLCPLVTPPEQGSLMTWGASRAIAKWTKLAYSMPDWEIVKTINSKVFSFTHSPKLPGSALLFNEKELKSWIEKTPGPKVLKTPFGTAGTGHFHVGKKALPTQFPLIGEPWVERVLDFSTQWKIENNETSFLGATLFHNQENGTYLGTFVGKNFAPYEWALEEHFSIAKPLLKKIAELGFFGNLGIDAYVYRWKGEERLQPVVEINGRKTMSWVALEIQKKYHPEKSIYFSYGKSKNGLLPQSLGSISFERNILITVR